MYYNTSSTSANRPFPFEGLGLTCHPNMVKAARYGPLVWQEFLNRPAYAATLPVWQYADASCTLGKKRGAARSAGVHYRVLVDGRYYGNTKVWVPSDSTLEATLKKMFGDGSGNDGCAAWRIAVSADGDKVVEISTSDDPRPRRPAQQSPPEPVESFFMIGGKSAGKKHKHKDKDKDKDKDKGKGKEKEHIKKADGENLEVPSISTAHIIDATIENDVGLPNMRVCGGGKTMPKAAVMMQVGDAYNNVGEHHDDDCDCYCTPRKHALHVVPCGVRERLLEAKYRSCCGGPAQRTTADLMLAPIGSREEALFKAARHGHHVPHSHLEVRKNSRELEITPIDPSEACTPSPTGRCPCYPGLVRLPATTKCCPQLVPAGTRVMAIARRSNACHRDNEVYRCAIAPRGTRVAALLKSCCAPPSRGSSACEALVPAGSRVALLTATKAKRDDGCNCCCRRDPPAVSQEADDLPHLEPYKPAKSVGMHYDDLPELEPYKGNKIAAESSDMPTLEPYYPSAKVAACHKETPPELEPFHPKTKVSVPYFYDMPEEEPSHSKTKVKEHFELPEAEPFRSSRSAYSQFRW